MLPVSSHEVFNCLLTRQRQRETNSAVVSGVGSFIETTKPLVAKWILLKDKGGLYGLSWAVSGVLKGWLDDQILDSFGDQTWIDMSKESTEFMYRTAKNW